MNHYTDLDVEGYERVVRCDNSKVGFNAWIAVHDSTMGPALGGCRVWNYSDEEAALTDVLRLSKGMTYKNALARLDLGGGKSVVKTDLTSVDRSELFKNFGKFVEYINGMYITAEDVNSTLADMAVVKEQTNHVATVGASGNPSPFTAYGVYCGIKASAKHRLKSKSLAGLTFAVQGVGETGGRLAEMLAKDGCRIIAADVNERNIRLLREKINFERVEADKILDVSCDVFSPCALGGIINKESISRLQCSIIAGSANNQLLVEEDGERLRSRRILYAPDFAINAGGVINISCEIGQNYDAHAATEKTAAIAECLTTIYDLSEKEGVATNRIANRLAEEIIAQRKALEVAMLQTG